MDVSGHEVSPCGRMTVTLAGALDAASARKTLDRISEMACDDVVVEFARGAIVSDVVLAFFVGAIARPRRGRLTLRGLEARQERLVATLGAGTLIEGRHPGG